MRKIFFVLLVVLIALPQKAKSQSNNTEAAIYNIGLGGFFGGIGAIINKKKHEKPLKVFLKGFWQGSVGGYLVYESKQMIYDFSKSENYTYAWGSKLLNAAGTSIIQNASSNRDFGDRWYLNIGFNRIEISTKNKFKVKYKVMPIALYGTIISASQGTFDFNRSLKTGTFIFNSKANDNTAITYVNSILMKSNDVKLLAHEIIHVLQYEDFITLNSFTNRLNEKLNNKYPVVRKLNKWIYFDTHALILRGMYVLENQNNKCYFDNFFEQEANFYSQRFNCSPF